MKIIYRIIIENYELQNQENNELTEIPKDNFKLPIGVKALCLIALVKKKRHIT